MAPRSWTGLARGPALFPQAESGRVEAWLPGLWQAYSRVGGAHTLSPFLHPYRLGQNLDGEGFRLESALFSSSPGVLLAPGFGRH